MFKLVMKHLVDVWRWEVLDECGTVVASGEAFLKAAAYQEGQKELRSRQRF